MDEARMIEQMKKDLENLIERVKALEKITSGQSIDFLTADRLYRQRHDNQRAKSECKK